MDKTQRKQIEDFAAHIRIRILKMLLHRTYGHLGGSMSIADVLAVLYAKHMRYDVKNPQWEDRDFLVLSKGHAGPGLYSALATAGFFDEQLLYTLNDNGTLLPSHPDRTKTLGVDATTGSLGQGTSVAVGMGQGLRMAGKNNYVYLIVGDGELNEGQCWEAFQYISAHNLGNVIIFIDENKRQLDGFTKDILNPFDLVEKMQAFGFSSQRVDGGDVAAISDAIDSAKANTTQATCIVLDTIKGQGVPYFEEMLDNHSVKFSPDDVIKAQEAIESLEKKID